MTIIAYRNGIMASDSLVTERGLRVGMVRKIARTADGCLVGGVGSMALNAAFQAWAHAHLAACLRCDEGFRPFVPAAWGDQFTGVVVTPDVRMLIVDQAQHLAVMEADFHAEGSGQAIALGAMAHGATAEEAVAIAIRLDTACGGPIQVERLA